MSKKLNIQFKGFLSFLILHELNMRRKTGDELAVSIGKLRNTKKLTAGTIYPCLHNLLDCDLINLCSINGREKYYTLTEEGHEELFINYKLFYKTFHSIIDTIDDLKLMGVSM